MCPPKRLLNLNELHGTTKWYTSEGITLHERFRETLYLKNDALFT